MRKQLTHGSTFSGIGAPEVAAEMLGIQNAFHCEINPFGRRVLDYWFPNAESYEDITKTDFRKWRGHIDILTGGFPCQPFSYAGKRRGAEDDRYLWPQMLRCIDEIRPAWFIGENVGGITTMVLPGETTQMGGQADIFGARDNYTRTEQPYVLDEICRNLENIGYSVQPLIIPACAVGAPHRRDRIFIIAHDERAGSPSHATRDGGCGESRGQGREIEGPHTELNAEPFEHGAVLPGPTADTPRHGSGAPQASGGSESDRGNGILLESQRRDTPERPDGLPEVSGYATDPEHDGLQHDMERGGKTAMPSAQSRGGQDPISAEIQRTETDGGRGTSPDANNNNKGPDSLGGISQMRRAASGQPREIRGEESASDNSDTPDARDLGLQERMPDRLGEDISQAGAGMDNPTQRPCNDGTAPHTLGQGLEGKDQSAHPETLGQHLRRDLAGCGGQDGQDVRNPSELFGNGRTIHGEHAEEPEPEFRGSSRSRVWRTPTIQLTPENRWRSFPTQSPVCRGNDGLPFDVDRLTISAGKWRTETLKAYGNAIVVQVMYNIFKAIKETEENENTRDNGENR